MVMKDMMPELIGQFGIVRKVTTTQGKKQFALDGPAKTAWYDEEQLVRFGSKWIERKK